MGHFNLILVDSEKYGQNKKCGLIPIYVICLGGYVYCKKKSSNYLFCVCMNFNALRV